MNVPRIIFSILGLVCIFLFYFTKLDIFLLIAVVSFVLGFYLMGAFRRSSSSKAERKKSKPSEKKSPRD